VVGEANSSIRGKVIVTGGTGGVMVTARPQLNTGMQFNVNDVVDQNGNFEFNKLMPGSYEVTARAMGRLTEVKQMVTVTAGNVSTITLTLDLSKQ